MSLFGNYIADMQLEESTKIAKSAPEVDAADAFYEAAMKVGTTVSRFDYYESIIDSMVQESTDFENSFINEFAFITEAQAGEKKNLFKKLLDKFIEAIREFRKHIKAFGEFIAQKVSTIKNKGLFKKAKDCIQNIKNAKENKELTKKFYDYEVLSYTPEFLKMANNVTAPKDLKLNFGYGSNGSYTKNREGQGFNNREAMSNMFILDKGEEACISTFKGGSIEELYKRLDAAIKVSEDCDKQFRLIDQYAAECEKMALKVKEIADKDLETNVYAQASGEKESEDYGKKAAADNKQMYADYKVLNEYKTYLIKAVQIITKVNKHNMTTFGSYYAQLERYNAKVNKDTNAA